MTPAEIKAAAEAEGVSVKAIQKRVRGNIARGCSDLLAKHRGGHYKITENQAKVFWHYVKCGASTVAACEAAKITLVQGKNIRIGKTWNHITGKERKTYGEY